MKHDDGAILSSAHGASASEADARRGALGTLTFILNDRFRVEGVALRMTIDGRVDLRFPSRRTGDLDLEEQVLAALEQASEGRK